MDYSDVTTDLVAFPDDNAAVTMSMAGKIDPIQGLKLLNRFDRDQALNQLKNPNIPTEQLRTLASKQSNLVEVINRTMAAEFDMAASMTMTDGMELLVQFVRLRLIR